MPLVARRDCWLGWTERAARPCLVAATRAMDVSPASNGHVLAFDDVSGLPAWISDTLCRLPVAALRCANSTPTRTRCYSMPHGL